VSALIQIAVNTGHKGYFFHTLQAAKTERPQEILDYIAALERMFKRVGMAEYCGKCWRGENFPLPGTKKTHHSFQGVRRGCCGQCPSLGHSACITKPMLCAEWLCGSMALIFPELHAFTQFLAWQYRSRNGIQTAPYVQGVVDEGARRYSGDTLKTLRVLRHAIDAYGR